MKILIFIFGLEHYFPTVETGETIIGDPVPCVDIAVIGYDDIELASFMTPPLTTIHQPKDELGELAIDVLIHRITQPTLQQQRLQLTPILMERGSA